MSKRSFPRLRTVGFISFNEKDGHIFLHTFCGFVSPGTERDQYAAVSWCSPTGEEASMLRRLGCRSRLAPAW